jgi:hypothetical protein
MVTTKKTTKQVIADLTRKVAPAKNVKAASAANAKASVKKPAVKKVARSGSVSGAAKPAAVNDPAVLAAVFSSAAKPAVKKPIPIDKSKKVPAKKPVAAKSRRTSASLRATASQKSATPSAVSSAPSTVLPSIDSSNTTAPEGGNAAAINAAAVSAAAALAAAAATTPNPFGRFLKEIGLTDKLVNAYNQASKFFDQVGEGRSRELWHVVHYFEQWCAVIERVIKADVAVNTEESFNTWLKDVLAKAIEPGEYVRIEFLDGTRAIALGTIMLPAVIREVEHDFLKQMKSFNPSFAGVMESRPEFQRTLILCTNLPPLMRSIMSYRERGKSLDLDLMHDVFGSPMLQLIPGVTQFNFNERLKMARKVLA